MQGCIVFLATVYLIVNLLVDLAYAWLDPRIRYGAVTVRWDVIAAIAETALADEQPVRRPSRVPLAADLSAQQGRGRSARFCLLFWIVVALLGPSIAPYDPIEMLSRPRRPPSADFWLGTDCSAATSSAAFSSGRRSRSSSA